MSKLVIVESPAKAKTIKKYLGGDYEVIASMGHVRDLPKARLCVDVKNDFKPKYAIIKGKEKLVSELKEAAEEADTVYLATDPDREGEAISWHLAYILGLDEDYHNRVTFNEITKTGITEGMAHPRSIDQNLVNAQQARRILDRLVGYSLSPFLAKTIRRGLSAGRVQSVALRIIVDREEEIRKFKPEEYWSIDARLTAEGSRSIFGASFYGDKNGEIKITNKEQSDKILADLESAAFMVESVKKGKKNKQPAPPFITSTLQQEASRKLGFQAKRTMKAAQELYEGVDIEGMGAVGLITYMRTDSLRLSEEALAAAKDFISARYGERYYAGSPRRFRKKEGAQDAHEAIRPSNVRLDPESVKDDLTKEQYRLYKLIWSRFVACQMADALYDAVQIDAVCKEHVFRAGEQVLKFPGFTAVYEEGRDDESAEKPNTLPELDGGERLTAEKTEKEQHFTNPPARYTEATLVKAMEDRGVGRPSTYATIVATIQDREYVIKKDKHLSPTPLGVVVTDLMIEHFNDVIDVEFTANMEHQLDEVEAGKRNWKAVLREFYKGFHAEMEEAEEALDGKRIKVPDEVSDEVCELCGRQMVVKSGRFGRFLACPGFPECKNTKPLVERMPGRCPKCGSGILKRKSKKGYVFYACERGAECGFMTWDVPTANDCPSCGQTLFKKSGKGRMKPFCINEACPEFVPEDKRGYRRRMPKATTETVDTAEAVEETPAEEAPKTAAKKTAAKKTTAKKTAAKKSAAKKPAKAAREPKA